MKKILLLFVVLGAFIVPPKVLQASRYMLGPKDIVTIAIFAGGEEQAKMDITVSEEGVVNAPFVGPMKAVGLSTSQLETAIHTLLARDFFVNPQVIIQIKEYNSLSYTISGAVNKPGKYTMQSAATLMSLIAKSEGTTLERGSVAYIMHNDSKGESSTRKVNLIKLLDEGDMSYNLTLQTGDSVYIPLAKSLQQSDSKVFVGGRVKKPGLQEYQPGLTAYSVCLMAGGFDDFAAPNRATIIRTVDGKQTVIDVDLDDVVDGKAPDFPLLPGDKINIPESWL